MGWASKLKFYRNLFIAVFVANLFCVFSGVIVGYFHWSQGLTQGVAEYQFQIILIGLLTLVFGLILPGVIIVMIHRELHKARREVDAQIALLLNKWIEVARGYGDAPFKNPDFWVQLALLTAEQAGRYYTSHPMGVYATELAAIVRLELKKQAYQ